MARPSLRDFFKNFDDYDASWEKKVRKAFTNNAKKIVTLSDCCGHPGEPGCWQKATSPREGGHEHPHRHDRPVEDQLHELKDRLDELSSSVDELLARRQAEQPSEPPATDETPPLTPPS